MVVPCGLKYLHLDSYGLQIFSMGTTVSFLNTNQDLFDEYCLAPTRHNPTSYRVWMNFYHKNIHSILHYCTYIFTASLLLNVM